MELSPRPHDARQPARGARRLARLAPRGPRHLGARLVAQLGLERTRDRARLRLERELRPRCARRLGVVAAVPRRLLQAPTRARALGEPRLHRASRRAADPEGWPPRSRGASSSTTRSWPSSSKPRRRSSPAPTGAACARSHVVAAVPPSVLRRIAIEPKLPAAQAEAVATLPSQPLTQVYFAPRSRFWEQDGYAPSLFTDTRAGMLAAARNRDDPTEVTSLTAWITGDNAAALDRLPPAEAGRAVLAAIETLRPAARDQLELIGYNRGARTLMPAALGRIFGPARSRGSPRCWDTRTAGSSSAASISRPRAAAWKARWSPPRRPPRRSSNTPETRAATWVSRPSRLIRLGHSGRRS